MLTTRGQTLAKAAHYHVAQIPNLENSHGDPDQTIQKSIVPCIIAQLFVYGWCTASLGVKFSGPSYCNAHQIIFHQTSL